MPLDEKYLQTVLRTLSHDVGAALRAASGFSQLLIDEYSNNIDKKNIDDKALRWLSIIVSEGQKAQGQLMALSRYARLYGINDREENCHLVNLCEQVLLDPDFRELAQIHSHVDIQIDKLPIVVGHPALWSTYFSEILNNCLCHSCFIGTAAADKKDPCNSVVTRVFCEEESEHISLIIENDGAGLSATELEKVLMPYASVGSVTHLGMGLAIAKRIVEIHDGHFVVLSLDDGVSGVRVIARLPKSIVQ